MSLRKTRRSPDSRRSVGAIRYKSVTSNRLRPNNTRKKRTHTYKHARLDLVYSNTQGVCGMPCHANTLCRKRGFGSTGMASTALLAVYQLQRPWRTLLRRDGMTRYRNLVLHRTRSIDGSNLGYPSTKRGQRSNDEHPVITVLDTCLRDKTAVIPNPINRPYP